MLEKKEVEKYNKGWFRAGMFNLWPA
uniref:Uncharacterized protein n=1 Tax=Lepeophtheirus salmonis TaxID=72036 RepID=A0A0K2VEL5_LEPSM